VDWDELLLKDAGLGVDGSSLLALLRQHTRPSDDPQEVDRLVTSLGSPEFPVREEASAKLVKLGLTAIPPLTRAKSDLDPEIRRRVSDCLRRIEEDPSTYLDIAIIRQLFKQQPEGFVDALVRYVPQVHNKKMEKEIYIGLEEWIVQGGKVPSELLRALRDPMPGRRALAAGLVGAFGTDEERGGVYPLLEDKDPTVRLRAAQGLLAANDGSGLPVLTALIEEAPLRTAWQAEELLSYVADEKPGIVIGEGKSSSRKKCRVAWDEIVRRKAGKVAVRERGVRLPVPRLLLVVEGPVGPNARCQVSLCGSDGQVRWRLDNMDLPLYLDMLPCGNVISVERVLLPRIDPREFVITERRGSDGMILWKRFLLDIEECCPFPEDALCVAKRNETLRMRQDGELKVLETLKPRGWEIAGVCRDTAEPIVFVRDQGGGTVFGVKAVHGRTGRELHRLTVRSPQPPRCRVESSVEGTLLILGDESEVIRTVDGRGEEVRVWTMPCRREVYQLRNGNLLVSGARAKNRLAEVDAAGRVVWEWFGDGDVRGAYPCLELIQIGFRSPRQSQANLDSLAYRGETLKHPDARVRRYSAEFLGTQDGEKEKTISLLIGALGDSDPEVRSAARSALVRLGSSTFFKVEKALQHPNPHVREEAVELMAMHIHAKHPYGKRGLTALLKRLQDETPKVRRSAVKGLGRAGVSDAVAIPKLIEALGDPAPVVQLEAAAQLVERGGQAHVPVELLLSLLGGKDDEIAWQGAELLGRIGTESEPVLAPLIGIARDRNAGARRREGVVIALGRLGEKAEPAIPVLIDIVKEQIDAVGTPNSLSLTDACIVTLGNIGKPTDGVIDVLSRIIQDAKANWWTRARAIEALSRLRPTVTQCLPMLEAMMGDRRLPWMIRNAVEKAVQHIRDGKQ
jgi:HEAT repeat protein